MAVTKADVLLIAPELAAVDDARFTAALEGAELQVNAVALGTRADAAKRYYVAHLLTVTQLASQGHGEVVSETVGSVSRTYAGPSSSGSLGVVESSRYWAEYMRIVRSTLAGPRTT
jgi:hypothetical protein